MREKIENLTVGYLILIIIGLLFCFISYLCPEGYIQRFVFIQVVMFYPALLIGKNLRKLEKFIKESKERF